MGSRLEKGAESTRKRIESHKFEDEEGEEYEGSKFGGFSEYFRRKRIKLQNLDAQVRSQSAGKPQIFRGIVCQVNGYTQPSLNDLHHLIVSHGGGFMQYLDGKTTVTHIIAASLTPKKAIEFRKYRIVKPAWIVDSVNAGKLLPWDNYRVLDEGAGQRVLGFGDGKVVSQANTQQRGYRDQTNTSWYTSQVKNVANNIDDEDGAQFPSTQVMRTNGLLAFTGTENNDLDHQTQLNEISALPFQSSGQFSQGTDDSFQKAVDSLDKILEGEEPQRPKTPNSSAGFDVTSSLEDVLNKVATSEHSLKRRLSTPSLESEDLDTSGVPLDQGLLSSPADLSTPIKVNESITARKRPREDVSPSPLKRSRAMNPQRDVSPSPLNKANSIFAESEDVNNKRGDFREHREISSSLPKRTKIITAEEHNALLLADPHMKKSSTGNPEFIKQYYAESRLHHLSTWKADLKLRFQQMAEDKTASQKQKVKRKPGSRKYIMHVDFDSFFCAVSLLAAPDFLDKPTVVAHGAGPGSEIASCNYPARAFGVTNGMWMKNALKLCPHIKVLPYDFPAYEEASKAFYEAIIDVGGIVQSVSIDEALVDVTSICLPAGGTDGLGVSEGSILREQKKADEIAQALRIKIKKDTDCEVSIGIGGNILLAKVALRKAKPAGQHQIKPEEIFDFIGELNVTSLPGIASSIAGKLEEIGIKLVKDIRQLNKDRLMTVLGPKTGEKIWDYARGIDRTEVGEQVVRKSVSAEVNWGIRFISQPEAEEFVQNLCVELQRRLIDQRVKGRSLTMKIMRRAADAPMDPPKNLGHGKCDTFNKSIVLGVATNSAEVIGREAISILRSYGFSPGELRGLGVQMTKLEPLKASSVTMPDGSQRKINFGKSSAPSKLSKQVTEDPIDDPETPTKAKSVSTNQQPCKQGYQDDLEITPKPKPFISRLISYEPIDDDSPKQAKGTPVHPAAAIARANAADRSATKLLNITGTQFIIPSQIDPFVLAELPLDIRTKLMAQGKSKSVSRPISREESPFLDSTSRSESPFPHTAPLPSQLDPEVFDALPEDMKAEVLASYSSAGPSIPKPSPSRLKAQSLLPQSPRKQRALPPPKRTPTKPRRGRPSGALNKKNRVDPYSTLTQSNFVAPKFGESSKSNHLADPDSNGPGGVEEDEADEELDADFLSALPPDMRAELLAEQKRKRLARKGALALAHKNKKRRPPDAVPPVQRLLRLPPRETKPTFTTKELTTLEQLRDTLSAWFGAYQAEGPHPDDVGALERYLRRVVMDERDVAKAVGVCRWIAWLVSEMEEQEKANPGQESVGLRIWIRSLEGVKEAVQEAVRERGLGRVDL